VDYDQAGETAAWDQTHADAIKYLRKSQAFVLTAVDGDEVTCIACGIKMNPQEVADMLARCHDFTVEQFEHLKQWARENDYDGE
jgi:hypothetical protein